MLTEFKTSGELCQVCRNHINLLAGSTPGNISQVAFELDIQVYWTPH